MSISPKFAQLINYAKCKCRRGWQGVTAAKRQIEKHKKSLEQRQKEQEEQKEWINLKMSGKFMCRKKVKRQEK